MPEDMRAAFAAWCDACRLDPPADFVINAHHGNVGCAGANKDFPHISFRAAMPEVLDQRFPDGLKQGQKRMITRFGAADVQNVPRQSMSSNRKRLISPERNP